ncbi:MAG: RAMP superfamily protein [Chloroflexi bacterium]|nr:RAMP superfamily protein [Chloroflexota bacterium]
MTQYQIQLKLLSDTTFSRGDGVAGLIDREVEHDEYGLPYLHGRTLKGLLGEEADNLLDAMQQFDEDAANVWRKTRNNLFGTGGSDEKVGANVHYSPAQLPGDLRETIRLTLKKTKDNRLTRQDVLESLTSVRRQTAVNGDGLPHDGSLRSMRVIVRQTTFTSRLHCSKALDKKEIALLSAAVMALHRAGTGRNRGRGHLQADLLDAEGNSLLPQGYKTFTEALA